MRLYRPRAGRIALHRLVAAARRERIPRQSRPARGASGVSPLGSRLALEGQQAEGAQHAQRLREVGQRARVQQPPLLLAAQLAHRAAADGSSLHARQEGRRQQHARSSSSRCSSGKRVFIGVLSVFEVVAVRQALHGDVDGHALHQLLEAEVNSLRLCSGSGSCLGAQGGAEPDVQVLRAPQLGAHVAGAPLLARARSLHARVRLQRPSHPGRRRSHRQRAGPSAARPARRRLQRRNSQRRQRRCRCSPDIRLRLRRRAPRGIDQQQRRSFLLFSRHLRLRGGHIHDVGERARGIALDRLRDFPSAQKALVFERSCSVVRRLAVHAGRAGGQGRLQQAAQRGVRQHLVARGGLEDEAAPQCSCVTDHARRRRHHNRSSTARSSTARSACAAICCASGGRQRRQAEAVPQRIRRHEHFGRRPRQLARRDVEDEGRLEALLQPREVVAVEPLHETEASQDLRLSHALRARCDDKVRDLRFQRQVGCEGPRGTRRGCVCGGVGIVGWRRRGRVDACCPRAHASAQRCRRGDVGVGEAPQQRDDGHGLGGFAHHGRLHFRQPQALQLVAHAAPGAVARRACVAQHLLQVALLGAVLGGAGQAAAHIAQRRRVVVGHRRAGPACHVIVALAVRPAAAAGRQPRRRGGRGQRARARARLGQVCEVFVRKHRQEQQVGGRLRQRATPRQSRVKPWGKRQDKTHRSLLVVSGLLFGRGRPHRRALEQAARLQARDLVEEVVVGDAQRFGDVCLQRATRPPASHSLEDLAVH